MSDSKEKNMKKLSIWFGVITSILVSWAVGVALMKLSNHPIPLEMKEPSSITRTVYSPCSNITVTTVDGKSVTLTTSSRLCISSFDQEQGDVYFVVDLDTSNKFSFPNRELKDTNRFVTSEELITTEKEMEKARREAEERYNAKVNKRVYRCRWWILCEPILLMFTLPVGVALLLIGYELGKRDLYWWILGSSSLLSILCLCEIIFI